MQAKFSLSDWNLSQRGQVIACSTKLRCRSTELSLRCAPASFWRIASLTLAVLRPWFAVESWQCFPIIFGKISNNRKKKVSQMTFREISQSWDTFASVRTSSSYKSEYLKSLWHFKSWEGLNDHLPPRIKYCRSNRGPFVSKTLKSARFRDFLPCLASLEQCLPDKTMK